MSKELAITLGALLILGIAWGAYYQAQPDSSEAPAVTAFPEVGEAVPRQAPKPETPEKPVPDEPQAAAQDDMPAVSAKARAHLCYLSFNNPYEASVARTFANALAEYPEAPKIKVTEYQGMDADPEKALERLVRSGTRCDGLVLSGHHDEDGEFWGDRTDGDLEIDFLYELSAEPRLGAWFSQVNALWLQGCHTATTRVFNPEVKAKYRVSGSPLGMINRHLNFKDFESSIDDLNDIFLENTEEDNIILSYARVFPSATIYTWWDKAPGVEAGSHWSLPFHVVQTSYLIDPDERYFQHPFKKPVPKAAALRYAEILYEAMTRPTWPGHHPGPLGGDEDMFIKGWKEHGLWAIHKREYSFENASAVGHRSLLSSQSGLLRQLRGFTSLLQQFDNEWVAEDPTSVVRSILINKESIPYNVYLLWAIAQRSGHLKARIQASDDLRAHLESVLEMGGEDSQLKRDYQRFHSYLYTQS